MFALFANIIDMNLGDTYALRAHYFYGRILFRLYP